MRLRHPFRARRLSIAAFTGVLILPFILTGRLAGRDLALQPARAFAQTGCALNSANPSVQHVIYVQFDNTHLTRDRPNVPSDLEQMPHLLSFIQNNGVMLSNHHTPLISHTSEDILTSLTGVYPNRHGVAVGQNSYQFYSNGSPTSFTTAFTYWTDTIGNGTYNMLSGSPTASKSTGTNAPAPWVPYTRAGCDVGGVASANQVLENANVNSKFGANDIGNVYGVNSPEAQETSASRTSDFVGIAVHCSQAESVSGGRCSSTNHGRPDALPDEPGGYAGYSALFGHKYVAPLISTDGSTTIKDLSGNPIGGFPGFDNMTAPVSLGYVAAMQEHGIPVTYAYISDLHDQNPPPKSGHNALGSGEQIYEQQLKSYDDAFATFFTRLASDGINQSNTLFVFTSDEGDHFTAGPPTNPGCTGATIDNSQNPPVVTPGNYCVYNKTPSSTPPGPPFGEVATGLDGLLAQQEGLNSYAFTLGNDTAPGVYLNGDPGRGDPSVRTFERATGDLKVTDPLSNNVVGLAQYMADPVEMNLLHMVTADPSRTPTFTVFAHPDLYVTGTCNGGFNSTPPAVYGPACVLEKPAFAWLHGNVHSDTTNTWLGMVGPGVRNLGLDSTTWSDHTDIRPTMMSILGLQDDYSHDGRVLFEDLVDSSLASQAAAHRQSLTNLAVLYKELNAPVNVFGLTTLDLATIALQSTSTNDIVYGAIEGALQSAGAQRDALAAQAISILEGAEFGGQPASESQVHSLSSQIQAFLIQVNSLDAAAQNLR